jgi:glutamine synthetase
MTGITAEKHDSFISPSGGGNAVMSFSGKALVRGESDASSLPSGGLRATFEARGYTVWDPTSYAFIKDGVLCIPTAFCSYSGEALDMKTPLLRSMQALDKQAKRILTLFGHKHIKRVLPTVGAEQEYFLIDKAVYLKRPDLLYCGRTLIGGQPPKGQELGDHYYGAVKPRVSAFMKELDEELWKLGIAAKTKHNETAPAQHELASVYTTANISADHNQLIMECMRRIADKHGMACLLHEKPFAGINGSGKHNNWSLAADTGLNLLEPGKTPNENAQFLLFLTAVIAAVDEYAGLLRASVANAGNDHRLGGDEAPPPVLSIYVGEQLGDILDALARGKEYSGSDACEMEIGAVVLPHFPKDSTDRNRTSPFAFTGDKLEFRMPGSSFSISEPNTVLNTAVSEILCRFADRLEKAEDFVSALQVLIRETVRAHKRVIFNGNGYGAEWADEAAKRGLPRYDTTPDALPSYITAKSIALFERHGIFTAQELHSRYEVFLENYNKTMNIEALTLLELVRRKVVPAAIAFQNDLAQLETHKKNLGEAYPSKLESSLLMQTAELSDSIGESLSRLSECLNEAAAMDNGSELARFYRDSVYSEMCVLRKAADDLETLAGGKHWDIPVYGELLYSVV